MRVSRLMLVTLRDDPAEAEIPSHKLLLRAGFIRRLSPGIYAYLPLMWRVLRKVAQVVREEMDRSGALDPAEFGALMVACEHGDGLLDAFRELGTKQGGHLSEFALGQWLARQGHAVDEDEVRRVLAEAQLLPRLELGFQDSKS